ncbi:pirin family protein [Aestuariivirga litoralis]|uniref:pirin family protein n=1 Tax=Aestuariivirga litoralis TaxID=2650924 RepID=UPI0018C7BC25|nr:pirin family protein [Aestuariivirga litoralis]MBG1231318.1 pirin family protein [Aestuariivirga litoralis]
MTLPHIPDPIPGDAASVDAIEHVIVPRVRDIGDFEVHRALPAAERQMIGPFIFFDRFGPVMMKAGKGMDVRPHPHIGLSTVTWLFDGVIYHRDSLGSEQPISPGELNWMTAGKGIVHSERTPALERTSGQSMFGLQSWVALPKQFEETSPGFEHVAEAQMPIMEDNGRWVKVIAGEMFGERSPVKTHSDLFYGDVRLEPGAILPLPPEHEERGLYLINGRIEIAGREIEAGKLVSFKPKAEILVKALEHSHFMLLGGEPMDGPRHIWWNFVSSSKEKIDAAKEEWRTGKFKIVPGDDKEFIPLPV